MEILRNMWRRKFRTFLTVMGISVGILAFTVMGSLALKLNKMIDGGKKYMTGQITISPKGSNFMTGSGGGTLPIDLLNKIKNIEGVSAVAPGVELALKDPDPDNPTGGTSFGPPPTIEGYDTEAGIVNRNWTTLEMKEGKMIDKNSKENDIAVGTTIALENKLKVGDQFEIRGKKFNVVGVLDKTMTGPDTYVFMPIESAQKLYVEANPFLKSLKEKSDQAATISDKEISALSPDAKTQIMQSKSFKIEDINTAASVGWKDGTDPEIIVQKLKDQFKNDVIVLSPKKMGEEIDKASAQMNAIIFGAAILALIVGLFSIVNTMIMSISERTKEIGIKKAIGASGSSIAREYTFEAGVISLLGGLVGMGLGVLIITIVNGRMASSGAEIFLLQANFLVGVVVFSFVIGIIAGILPALRASKLRVVEAIREL
ncbi:MAG: ABC transporter permease [Candidatus Berkelbacteria bacterium]